MPNRRTTRWIAALIALFGFRLLFGLSSDFFAQDETQIFLMGLRYQATAAWPYFGPDVVWTSSEIPGALQPLLVGLPLRLAPVPEAPFVLLNLLSTGALGWFAWYICQRIPSAPRWLVTGWLLTIPWTLEFSTHIDNSSYVLPAAVIFFIGFFEAVPAFGLRKMSPVLAHALMGLAVTWILQVHMSWPLLLPYAFGAWVSRRRDGVAALARNAGAFAAGCAIPGLLLVPTLVEYGLSAGAGGTFRNLHPHAVSPAAAVTVLARFFSFASLEVLRFLELTTAKRMVFLAQHWWLAPLAVVAWAVGIAQPLWMLREWFRRKSPYPEWATLKVLVAGTVVLVYASYWFAIERASQAHAFYLLAPLAFVFAAYCWTFLDSPTWRRRAAAILAINVAYHAGLAWAQAPERSMYKNREVVATAIRLKQPEMFGHRRAFAVDVGTPCLCRLPRDPDPRLDMAIGDAARTTGPRGLVQWTFTLRNQSSRSAFRDVVCVTKYRDAAGATVETRQTLVSNVFQPGEIQFAQANDGFIQTPFATATLEIMDAEALRSTPRPDPAER